MPTWTEKQNEVQAQLASEHTAVLAALNGLQAAIETGNTNNIAHTGYITDAIGLMQASVEAIYPSLTQLMGDTDTLISAVGVTNSRLSTALTSLTSLITNTESADLHLEAIADSTGDRGTPDADSLLGRLNTLTAFVDEIITLFGPPGDATGWLLPTLHDIRNCICKIADSYPSSPSTHPDCEEFVSTGQAFYPSWPGFGTGANVARWTGPLPDGVEFGTIFSLTYDDAELYRAGGWQDVLIWVESDAPSFALSFATTERYATNAWIPLPEVDNISVSVDSISGVVAYLCIPVIECTYESATVVYSGNPGVPWTSYEYDVSAYTHVYFAASSDPYNVGHLELYVDSVLIDTIDPILSTGVEHFVAISGALAWFEISGTTAAYVTIRGCPPDEE